MHQQIRSAPALSPADLEAFLQVLANESINILAAGGSDVELGGEFAIGVADEDIDRTVRVLTDAGYVVRVVDVQLCWLENRPGALLECIATAAKQNRDTGKRIRDVAVGVPDDKGLVPVQVYSEEAASAA